MRQFFATFMHLSCIMFTITDCFNDLCFFEFVFSKYIITVWVVHGSGSSDCLLGRVFCKSKLHQLCRTQNLAECLEFGT